MSEASTVIASYSPNGNVQAMAEQDERVAYFYLTGSPDSGFGVKACWVRNLIKAPAELDVESMKRGEAPMLYRDACAHPDGAPPLEEKGLRIVWFEEGDAAALLDGPDVLAIIPAWSGLNGFDGYARDCLVDNPLCWPLSPVNALFERIRRADTWWKSWDTEDVWGKVQDALVGAYEAQFGQHSKYYAIDGGKWPPKALLRFDRPEATTLVTAGVCLRPQPAVEMATERPETMRRIELGMSLGEEYSQTELNRIMDYVGAQTNYPWTRFSWLGYGHTFPCDSMSPARYGTPFPFILFWGPEEARVQLPDFRGDCVNLLWMVPITEQERHFAESNRSEALMARLVAKKIGVTHTSRSSVV